MAKQEDAQLILKLYELRREAVMRQARNWFTGEFHPASLQSVLDALRGEQSAFFRMITSYWEMAATMVAHGAIDAALFHETNGEHMYVFAKLQPFIADVRRETGNPRMLQNLEKISLAAPNAETTLKAMRERQAAAAQAKVAKRG